MKTEIKGLYFEADTGFRSGEDDYELTPRDEQREAVLRQRGLPGLEELEKEYREIDSKIEEAKKRQGTGKPQLNSRSTF